MADNSPEYLFGDSITDSLESLQKEKKLKQCWKKGQIYWGKGNIAFHNSHQTSKPLPRPSRGHRIKGTMLKGKISLWTITTTTTTTIDTAVQKRTPTTETPARDQRNTVFFPKYIAGKRIWPH